MLILGLWLGVLHYELVVCCWYCVPPWTPSTSQLVWRRHLDLPFPSHHDIRTTCMQLLPLVEMYCKYELLEDCTSLWRLMVCFDSELELESHELGRSLLFMVRDEATTHDILPQIIPLVLTASPFDIVRERLAATWFAIRSIHHQVFPLPCLCLLSKFTPYYSIMRNISLRP